MQLDEFIEAIGNKEAPAPASKIVEFEQALGTALPNDYRDFLLATNGGYVGGALWFQGEAPWGGPFEAGVHHILGFREQDYLSLEWTRRITADVLHASVLVIMDDPGGNLICLGLPGPYYGHIYFWDHESSSEPNPVDPLQPDSGYVLLAKSFTEFVDGIDVVEDLEEI